MLQNQQTAIVWQAPIQFFVDKQFGIFVVDIEYCLIRMLLIFQYKIGPCVQLYFACLHMCLNTDMRKEPNQLMKLLICTTWLCVFVWIDGEYSREKRWKTVFPWPWKITHRWIVLQQMLQRIVLVTTRATDYLVLGWLSLHNRSVFVCIGKSKYTKQIQFAKCRSIANVNIPQLSSESMISSIHSHVHVRA